MAIVAHDMGSVQRTVRAAGRQLLGGIGSPPPGDARRRHSIDSLQVRETGTNAAAIELLQAIRSEAASQPPWARDDRKASDGAVVVRRSSRGTSTPQSKPRNGRGEIDLEPSRAEGRRKESPAGNQGRHGPGREEIARSAGRAARQRQEQQERWGVAPPWSSQAAARGSVPNQRQPSKGTPIRTPASKPADLGPIAAMWRTACEPNSAFRSHMEDSSVVIDPFLAGDRDGDNWGYFAVYDGHGGRQAVDYVETKLHGLILEELKAAIVAAGADRLTDEAVSDSMSKAFYRVDEQLKNVGTWRCGCTATVVLAHRSPGSLRLHVANVGDSRSIAIDSANSEWRISRDHRPNDPAEIQRVESEGGFVTRGRVAGQLGVSRALGDHSLKSVGVTWRPSVCARDATQDTALVIGSDGLWDAMGDADVRVVVDRAMSEKAHDKAADILVREAWKAGSTDNITALVAFFGKTASQGVGRPRTGGA